MTRVRRWIAQRSLSSKIFAAILITNAAITAVVFAAIQTLVLGAYEAQYWDRVLKTLSSTGQALHELERQADTVLRSSAAGIAARMRTEGLVSETTLAQWGAEFGIDGVFVTDMTGKFVRATVGKASEAPNMFSFCPLYRGWVETGTPFVPTGIVLSVPGKLPFKFYFLADRQLGLIIETAVHADFVGKTLFRALAADPEFRAVELVSPSGASLSRHEARGGGGTVRVIETRVAAASPVCCSCKRAGLTESGEYFYTLRARVSEEGFLAARRNLSWVLLATALIVAGLGIWFSAYVARSLGGATEARIRFAEQFAHDVRGPIGALKVALTLPPGEARVLIEGAIDRVGRIVGGLRGGAGFSRGPTCARDEVERVVREKNAAGLATGVEVRLLDFADPPAQVEMTELGRVVANLLDNAIEASSSGGPVTVGAKVGESGGWELRVADLGSGMSARQLATWGRRGVSSKPGGQGLGAFAARGAVEKWNGRVSVVSEVGRGTVVTAEVPFVDGAGVSEMARRGARVEPR